VLEILYIYIYIYFKNSRLGQARSSIRSKQTAKRAKSQLGAAGSEAKPWGERLLEDLKLPSAKTRMPGCHFAMELWILECYSSGQAYASENKGG
jgi:hypothetical protein